MNCLQLQDLYRQRVLTALYKVKTTQVPELLLNYCHWNDKNSRRWFNIRFPVQYAHMDKILPQRHQFQVWNTFFTEETIDLLEYEVTTKNFSKNIKARIMESYYEECTEKHCYSCKERLRVQYLKEQAKLEKQHTKNMEELELQRKEDEERYWYLIEPTGKQPQPQK